MEVKHILISDTLVFFTIFSPMFSFSIPVNLFHNNNIIIGKELTLGKPITNHSKTILLNHQVLQNYNHPELIFP